MQAGYEISTSSDGVRGAFATEKFQNGDLVAKLPLAATIQFDASGTSFPAEHAHQLAVNMFSNRSLLSNFYPYLATLPAPGKILSSETFPDELISELQSTALESIVVRERSIADAVYLGRFDDPQNPEDTLQPIPLALAEYGGLKAMPLPAFRHLASIVSTRELAIVFPDGDMQYVLAPAIDMLNSDASKTNVELVNDGESILLYATRNIEPGEELFLEYLPGVDHRPDISLIGYGYVRKMEKPLLAATDLPTFDHAAPYKATPPSDEVFYGPGGKYNTAEEYGRLATLMLNSGTTLEEDESRLKDETTPKSWKEKTVLEFRVARKKAITLALEAIMDELQAAAVDDALGASADPRHHADPAQFQPQAIDSEA